MSAPLVKPMSVETFLAWEAGQELRFEFDGFAPMAMTGGTAAHATIQANLITALSSRLRGLPCRVFGSDLKIEVAGSIRYPDAFVVCTPVAPRATVVREPVVIFEILSDSTGAVDRIQKNREYRATPSVRRYVMLEQTRIGAMVFSRDGDAWLGRVVAEGEILDMPEIGITVPLGELYGDVDFETQA